MMTFPFVLERSRMDFNMRLSSLYTYRPTLMHIIPNGRKPSERKIAKWFYVLAPRDKWCDALICRRKYTERTRSIRIVWINDRSSSQYNDCHSKIEATYLFFEDRNLAYFYLFIKEYFKMHSQFISPFIALRCFDEVILVIVSA